MMHDGGKDGCRYDAARESLTTCSGESIHSASRLDAPCVEIACDESGYEGEKLIGVSTDVFSHGATRLDSAAADACMRELRRRNRSPAVQYGAGHVLREKHRNDLLWLLGPAPPLRGNSRVYLVDKAFYVVAAVVRLLGGVDGAPAEEMIRALYRAGRRLPEQARWENFLAASNEVLRVKAREQPDATTLIDAFFQALEALPPDGFDGCAGELLRRLQHARPRAVAVREQLQTAAPPIAPLDPLIPAIMRAVANWSEGGRTVSVVHDQHNALADGRVGQLIARAVPLAGLKLVDSRLDARIQLADILAGVARKFASDELNERGDPELTPLVREFVDPASIWGDQRSGAVLLPGRDPKGI